MQQETQVYVPIIDDQYFRPLPPSFHTDNLLRSFGPPSWFKFEPFALDGLGDAESNEVAARILYALQRHRDRWEAIKLEGLFVSCADELAARHTHPERSFPLYTHLKRPRVDSTRVIREGIEALAHAHYIGHDEETALIWPQDVMLDVLDHCGFYKNHHG